MQAISLVYIDVMDFKLIGKRFKVKLRGEVCTKCQPLKQPGTGFQRCPLHLDVKVLDWEVVEGERGQKVG